MESIYPPSIFNCSAKLTNLNEHFKEFSKECYGSDKVNFTGKESMTNTICKLYGERFSSDKLNARADICSIDKLTVPEECVPIDISTYTKYAAFLQKPIPDSGKSLHTVQARITWNKKCKARPKDVDNITLSHDFKKTIDFTPGSEILITVRVHQPYPSLPSDKLSADYKIGSVKCSHEIVILGSQTLKDFQDKILCASDGGAEIKSNVFQPAPENTSDYSSSLICLNNKLYIDMPKGDSIDYSVVVKQWAKEKELKETFITENMTAVKMSDLNFRLNYPYLYQHRGDCEHILLFSDIKLVKSTDSLCRDDYPFYKTINRFNMDHCNFCQKKFAQWLCVDNDRLVHDRAFLCNECMVSYNYIDGEKIGDFKVYVNVNKSLIN